MEVPTAALPPSMASRAAVTSSSMFGGSGSGSGSVSPGGGDSAGVVPSDVVVVVVVFRRPESGVSVVKLKVLPNISFVMEMKGTLVHLWIALLWKVTPML